MKSHPQDDRFNICETSSSPAFSAYPNLSLNIGFICHVEWHFSTTCCFRTYKHLWWRFENCFCLQNSTILIAVFVVFVLALLCHVTFVVVFHVAILEIVFKFHLSLVSFFGCIGKLKFSWARVLTYIRQTIISMFVKYHLQLH